MTPPAPCFDIILIGPIRSGKSTLGRLLAEALNVPQISMDALCWDYYREIGFEDPQAYPNVILLLPSPDPDRSADILAQRNRNNSWLQTFQQEAGWNPNEHFLRHPSNTTLAGHIVYTDGKSPEQTRDEILMLKTIPDQGAEIPEPG